jgi:hypothetical protein
MLKYNDVALGLLPDDVEEFVAHWHTWTDFRYNDLWFSDSSGLEHLPIPSPLPDELTEIGTLYWPTGLSRCAFGDFLITSDRLATLRTALGTGAGPADLVMTDATGNSRTFSLYFIAARPIFQMDDQPQLYVLTLADIRYFLRTKTGSLSSTPASWTALFSTVASALSITLTPDSIDSDYSTPTDRWKLYDKPLAVVADAAAAAVGHRIVADLDGTFRTVSYATASADGQAQYTALLPKTCGGQYVAADLRRPVPASVKVQFAQRTSGLYQPDPYTSTKTLSGLALSAYGSATGVSGQVQSLVAELAYDGTNATACGNYATQAATDWYLWQLADLDVTFPGTAEWEPSGWEERTEWKYEADKIVTRVVRGPFQTLVAGGWEGGPNSAGGPPSTPLTPLEGSVPAFDDGGNLTNTPVIVEQYTANGQPATKTTIYQTTEYDGDTPAIQYQIEYDGANYVQYVTHYTEGTDNPPTLQYQVSVDGIIQQFTVGDRTIYQQITQPSTGIIQFQTGNEAGTQGEIKQFQIDADGDIDVVTVQYQTDGASAPAQIQYQTDGSDTEATLTGKWDATGTTGAGFGGSSSRTEGTLAAAGSNQGNAAAIVTDAVEVTGADGTKGVILPNTTAGIIVVWNNDGGFNDLEVYPPSGAAITGLATNASYTMTGGSYQTFVRVTSTQWGFLV